MLWSSWGVHGVPGSWIFPSCNTVVVSTGGMSFLLFLFFGSFGSFLNGCVRLGAGNIMLLICLTGLRNRFFFLSSAAGDGGGNGGGGGK